MPVSDTRSTASSPSAVVMTSTLPPRGVYLIALLMRLSTTWRSRKPSPVIGRGRSMFVCRSMSEAAAAGANASAVAAAMTDRSNWSLTSGARWESSSDFVRASIRSAAPR
jgi:hypothetical protein